MRAPLEEFAGLRSAGGVRARLCARACGEGATCELRELRVASSDVDEWLAIILEPRHRGAGATFYVGGGARACPRVPGPRGREIEPLSADRFGVRFTADVELRELLERARLLASHRLPTNDLASLMRVVLGSFVKQEEARRFAVGRKPRRAKADATETKPRSYAQLRQAVLGRQANQTDLSRQLRGAKLRRQAELSRQGRREATLRRQARQA